MGIVKQIGEHSIIGNSQGIRDVFGVVEKAAASDSTVMIFGESGTGKELAARGIHESSNRRNGRFVPVNCGGLAEGLVESELFGHRKGAFSGAVTDQPGRLQCEVGGEVLSIEGDDIGNLQEDLREFLNIEGRVVDNVLRLTLSKSISLDDLRQKFQNRIKKLTLSHPSLDDVFVHFTGKHLASEEIVS